MESSRVRFVRAVEENDVGEVIELLRQGDEEVKERIRIGGDLVEHSAENGHMQVFRLLLESGAPIQGGTTDPFVRVCNLGNTEAIRLMIQRGAVLNVEHKGDLVSIPLRSAISGGKLEAVKMLVDAGAAVNGIWNHRTNLSLAIDKGYSEIADFLRASGARLPSELNSIQTEKVVPSLKDETIDTFSRHFGTPLDAAQYSLISGSPPVSIHVIPANPRCNYITLFTVGLAEQPMYVPLGQEEWGRAELFMQLPVDWQVFRSDDPMWGWPHLWLRELCQLPTTNQTWFGGKLCVAELKGLAPGLRFTGCLIWAQHFFESKFLKSQIITLYRVVPLTAAEVQFEKQHGTENLLNAMSLADVPLEVSLNRSDAVQ